MTPERTPVIGTLPPLLLMGSYRPERTPMINGHPARPLSQLIQGLPDEAEFAAAIQLAGVNRTDRVVGEVHEGAVKTSCAYFAQAILRGPPEAPYFGKYILGPHHIAWDELAQKYRRICILAARDHGKTRFFSWAFPIWKAGFNAPGSHGIIFSATQPQAELFLSHIKEEILGNENLQHMIPYSQERFWSARKLTFRNGSTIRAAGFGVKIRGAHPDYGICDDVLNDDDIYSETIRRRNTDYFLSAISGMFHQSKQLIVVGTPLHQADLYSQLKETGVYECRSYPAENPKTGQVLWPARYNLADLHAKKKELKSAARYAREFLCQPLSDEASLFPSKLFEGSDVRLPYCLGLPAEHWERMGAVRYIGVDIAMSAEAGADYFVIFTVAVNAKGERWLVNIRRGHGWSFTRQIDEIKEECYLQRPEVVHIEANQAQRVWSDEIIRTTSIPVRRFFTIGIGGRQPPRGWRKGATNVSVNKHHIDRGVPGMRISLENRKWRIPRGDQRSIELTDAWIGEMGAMGWINGKVQSVGSHDDMVMASWMCHAAIELGGRAELGFLEGEDIKPKQALAAPPLVDKVVMDSATLDAERVALASIQEGRPIEGLSPDSYLARVRPALRQYAEQSIDGGDMQRGARALAELQRLDALFHYRAYDGDAVEIARQQAARYGESWKPGEGAPRGSDFHDDDPPLL
jgi:hypothetical protein